MSQKISYFDENSASFKSGRRSLLDDYLTNPRLDLADVVGMACDLLLAGVDTVPPHSFMLLLLQTSIKHFTKYFSTLFHATGCLIVMYRNQ